MQQDYPTARTRHCSAAAKALFLSCLAAGLAQQPVFSAEGTAAAQKQPPVEELIKQVEAAPASAAGHLRLAQRYDQLGYISLAVEQYEQATKCPNAPPEAFKFLAQLKLRTKAGKEAEALVRKAAIRFPRDFGIFLTAGYVLQHQGHFDEAEKMYLHAAQLKPQSADIHAALADNYIAKKQYDKALAESDKALSLRKDFDAGNYEKARALSGLGKPAEAAALVEYNFRRDPLNTSNNHLYVVTLLQSNKTDEALVPLFSLLATSDGDKMDEYKLQISQLVARLPAAKVQASLAKSDVALAKSDVRARMHFAMGDVLDKLRQHAAAMKEYERGNELDPNFARGYLRLAEDQEKYSRDYKKAMSNYNKALSLDPKDPEICKRVLMLNKKLQAERKPLELLQDWVVSLFHK